MNKVMIKLNDLTIRKIPSYMGSNTYDKIHKICKTMVNDFESIESTMFRLGLKNSVEITVIGDREEVLESLDEFKDAGVLLGYKIENNEKEMAA